MLRTILALCFALVIAGCASTPQTTGFRLPNGETAQTTKCMADSVKCMQQAATTCGMYRVLDSESHAGGWAADLLPGPVTWYTMTYVCGNPDGKLPTFQPRGQVWVPPTTILQQQTVIVR